MRVLLLAEDDGLYQRGAETLRGGGHEVVGCHDAGSATHRFPCSGVTDTCPLDEGIDAAVALRRNVASPVESGIGCAIRQKVPLVLAGAQGGVTNGVSPFAVAIVDGIGDDLVEAVEHAATAPQAELSAAAMSGITTALEQRGIEAEVTVDVLRSGRGLRVVIHGPSDLDAPARAALGQAAFAPVRAIVPTGAVDSIDVSFEPAPSA